MVWVARRLCISPDGRVLAPGSAELCSLLGYREPDFDLLDYGVRNMGMVTVVLLPTGTARIRCRPRLLSVAAVRALCRELRDRRVSGAELSWVEDGTSPASWPNCRALRRRLRMSGVRRLVELAG